MRHHPKLQSALWWLLNSLLLVMALVLAFVQSWETFPQVTNLLAPKYGKALGAWEKCVSSQAILQRADPDFEVICSVVGSSIFAYDICDSISQLQVQNAGSVRMPGYELTGYQVTVTFLSSRASAQYLVSEQSQAIRQRFLIEPLLRKAFLAAMVVALVDFLKSLVERYM